MERKKEMERKIEDERKEKELADNALQVGVRGYDFCLLLFFLFKKKNWFKIENKFTYLQISRGGR